MSPPGPKQPAATDPVARLMVDVALSHLDRPFDYLVPAELDAVAMAGSRVRVRFAGRLVDGYVLERVAGSAHEGRLGWIERVVGPEPVLTAETTRLFRAVADRWAGSFVDVVRLGIPARHARAEQVLSPAAVPPAPANRVTGWERYRAGEAFLLALADGRAARAAWCALPGEDWPTRLAEAARAARLADRGAVLVVPDARDLARLDAAMTTTLGAGQHVSLSADLGPSERYRRWLAVRRGEVGVVIGTRSAAYAPVRNPGLLAVWDDGDDLHDEPRAPYPSVRDVLVLRASLSASALLIGGFARTAEAAALVESGWAHDVRAQRRELRAAAARVVVTGDDHEQARDPAAVAARLPSLALRTARAALQQGQPVLVQVPRAGYAPALACQRDRTPARCTVCSGPVAATSGHAIAACRWCGRLAGDWTCPTCGGRRLRAVVIGSGRTAEELGRAFPGVTVRTSSGERVLAHVAAAAELIVATPGAEPVASGGYGAVLLLDGWSLLARPDLRAGEEALRRWLNAAALAAPAGLVVLGADAAVPAVQAVVRWDPVGFAARELRDRHAVRFPPATRLASVTGPAAAVADLLAVAALPPGHELIGPVELADDVFRALVRVDRAEGAELAHALHAAAAVRSARKAPSAARVQLDPRALL